MATTSNVPPLHDLEAYRGDHFDFAFAIQTPEGVGIPQAGVTAMAAQVRATQDSTSALLATFATDITAAGTIGQFSISLTDVQTAALPLTGGFYDVQVTQNGKKKTRIRGAFNVVEQVTT